jgi:hypothetical protein
MTAPHPHALADTIARIVSTLATSPRNGAA